MSKVYITDYIDDPDIERGILSERLVGSCTEDVEALLVWHALIDRAFMERLPRLKGIVRYGVGFDNVDLEYTHANNIFVCNTPDYGIEEVSDTAVAFLMNIIRGVSRYDYFCRAYRDSWQEHTLQHLQRASDYTLGVIGAGRIGGTVILKANALRFRTCFFDPYKERGHEKVLNAERVDELDALLETADIVSFHAPLTDETRGMIDEAFLARMKPGSSLINTARGKVVKDVDVFYEPMKSGHLACVALDVLPEEPPKSSRLLDAWRAREPWLDGRLLINPHAAYYSEQAFVEMREKAAGNALRILEGKRPFNIVNGL